MENRRNDWEQEFRAFLDAEPACVPPALTEAISTRVGAELRPSFARVLGKLAAIQAIAGFASLSFCPQFGMSITGAHGLAHFLMSYGEPVCSLACGALFVGLSFLVASLLLRPEEVRAARAHRWSQAVLVAGLSLGAFAGLGASLGGALALAWWGGAVGGGLLSLELGWGLRRSSYSPPAA